MNIKSMMALLFLSFSTFAYNQQEISQLIHQQESKLKSFPHYPSNQGNHLRWEALQGPDVTGMMSTVVMKNNDTVIFAYHTYSYNRNLYKSTDGGEHWRAIVAPGKYKIHYLISLDAQRLLLAAGNEIYLSKDQGEHWIQTATIDASCDKLFLVNPNLILLSTNFAYTRSGLYRSIDGGQTFMPTRLGINEGSPFFAISGKDNILLTATDRIFISTNNGLLWTQPVKWANQLLSSAAINHQHDIFLATNAGLYKTDVDGDHFAKLNINHVDIIKIDEQDRLYAVGRKKDFGLYRSLDQGKNWELLRPFNKIIDFHLLDNGKVLVNSDEGLLLSDDSQFHYTKLEKLPDTSSISGRVLALDQNHFFATALAYSGPLYGSKDAGKTWARIHDAAVTDVVAFNHQLITLEYQAKNQQIMVSSDFGETWQLAFQISQDYCTSISSSPAGVMLNCHGAGYFTQDLLHWFHFKVKTKNPTFSSYFSGSKIYITDGDSIQSSNDHGQTWHYLLDNLNQYRAYISGYKDEVFIIAFLDVGIIKMTREGKEWDLINNGLTDYHFNNLIVLDQNHYFISTDSGVFYTQNGGKHWQAENRGLDNLAVLNLSLYQTTLLAGTEGSGVFKTELRFNSLH